MNFASGSLTRFAPRRTMMNLVQAGINAEHHRHDDDENKQPDVKVSETIPREPVPFQNR